MSAAIETLPDSVAAVFDKYRRDHPPMKEDFGHSVMIAIINNIGRVIECVKYDSDSAKWDTTFSNGVQANGAPRPSIKPLDWAYCTSQCPAGKNDIESTIEYRIKGGQSIMSLSFKNPAVGSNTYDFRILNGYETKGYKLYRRGGSGEDRHAIVEVMLLLDQ